jgi:hypothetical protein
MRLTGSLESGRHRRPDSARGLAVLRQGARSRRFHSSATGRLRLLCPERHGSAKRLRQLGGPRAATTSLPPQAQKDGKLPHDASPLMLMLEGVSQAEIGLDKVVSRQIGEVITNFGKNPDMGSKAIFKSAPNMAEHPIRSKVIT